MQTVAMHGLHLHDFQLGRRAPIAVSAE